MHEAKNIKRDALSIVKPMQMNATQSQDRERFVKLGSHDVDYVYKDQVLYLHPKEQLKNYPQKRLIV